VRVEVHEPQEEREEAMATVRDPVCGMDIDPAAAAASEEYDGRTHHFCSEGCHERFVAAPDRFASTEPALGTTEV
jgi:Cu+-exporting ATPase